eukprot:6784553-Prymnesium_polylepis.2
MEGAVDEPERTTAEKKRSHMMGSGGGQVLVTWVTWGSRMGPCRGHMGSHGGHVGVTGDHGAPT